MPHKKAYTHIHYQDIINLIISLYYKNIYNIRVPYKWGNGRGMFFCQVLYIIYIYSGVIVIPPSFLNIKYRRQT